MEKVNEVKRTERQAKQSINLLMIGGVSEENETKWKGSPPKEQRNGTKWNEAR